MRSVLNLFDALGRDAVRMRLDVSPSQMSNAVAHNSMPSSWYVCIRNMCVECGVECPDGLFTKMRQGVVT
jgi:hypothetical protein